MLSVVVGNRVPVINAYEVLTGEVEKYFTNLGVKGRLFKCIFHHFGRDLYGSNSGQTMGSCGNLRQLSINISRMLARAFEPIA
jgi:hypothetical protein